MIDIIIYLDIKKENIKRRIRKNTSCNNNKYRVHVYSWFWRFILWPVDLPVANPHFYSRIGSTERLIAPQ